MADSLKILVVDVGNTSTTLGQWEDGRLLASWHCDGATEEALALARKLHSQYKFHSLAYVSVVPRKDSAWSALAAELGLRLLVVNLALFQKAFPEVAFDYPEPETIGNDRLADAAGAITKFGAPVIVMDFGTAFTAAVLTGDKVWRGGVIAPGFPLMRDYLAERTAQLPRLELGFKTVPTIGHSTKEAMQLGMAVGYRGMVREIINELKKNFDEPFKLVATGGFSQKAIEGLEMSIESCAGLTLMGAAEICVRSL